jgi:hypothetical protein
VFFDNGRKLITKIEIMDVQYDHTMAKSNYPFSSSGVIEYPSEGISDPIEESKERKFNPEVGFMIFRIP